MSKLNRHIALWLLLVSLTAFNAGEFFHNHESDAKGDSEAKCPVCVLHSALSSADCGTSSVIITPLEFYSLFISQETPSYVSEFISSGSGRSPPFYLA